MQLHAQINNNIIIFQLGASKMCHPELLWDLPFNLILTVAWFFFVIIIVIMCFVMLNCFNLLFVFLSFHYWDENAILGFHSRDKKAILVYKTMAKCRSSFA